jgi:hypothetical protein
MNDRVDYVCTRAEHQTSEPNDALTMHEDSWAYCSGGGSGPHDWRSTPTGGMSLDDAKRFVDQTTSSSGHGEPYSGGGAAPVSRPGGETRA